MLKNSSGLQTEIEFSKDFHQQGIPFLVSSALLRERQLGQLDLVRLNKDREGWVIEVGEVKSSQMGEEQMQRSQKQRIFSAQSFLASLLGHRTKFISMTKEKS